jgi:uncharacterized lipoprotein YmbA
MRWIHLFATCLLMTFAGCASSDVITNASPIVTSAPVSLDLAVIETSTTLTAAEPFTQMLNDKIIIGLRETQIFNSVAETQPDSSDDGIKVKAVITKIKNVSPDARAWFGSLAGQAEVSIHLTVSDLKTGKQIQTFETEGKSGASARAGTTDAAIQQTAQRIVAQIIEITRRTSQ